MSYGSFTSEISLTPLRGSGKEWRVNDSFAWHVGRKGSDFHVLIPAGYVYDLASVPAPLRLIVPHTTAPRSSALHDLGYEKNELWVVSYWDGDSPVYHPRPIKCDRAFWDQQFYESMLVLDVPKWRAEAAYRGVRVGGWYAWNKHRKND